MNNVDNKKSFVQSLEHFATVIAIVATVLLTPLLLRFSNEFMRTLLLNFYGEDLTDFFMFGWTICAYLIVFFGLRASLVTALTAAAISFAVRFVGGGLMKKIFLILLSLFILSACADEAAIEREKQRGAIKIAEIKAEAERLINQDNIAYAKEIFEKTYEFLLPFSDIILNSVLMLVFAFFGYHIVMLFIDRFSMSFVVFCEAKVHIARYKAIEALALSGKDIDDINYEMKLIS